MAKSKKEKAVAAVTEAGEEVADNLTEEYQTMCDTLGKKAAQFQQASKISSAKHLRNAIRAIRFVIDELEK